MAQPGMEEPAASETLGEQLSGIRARLAKISKAVNGAFGVPDYDRYLKHFTSRFPGQTPLTREEFVKDRMHDRYEKPGNRCP
jgi:uncharacterized short protein YbdD (DUF466 family)